ncbi:MAG: GHKL domain-containing protein [Eubacterium sp.]|nr:GHKL domain-containing protein [Eubacterium sp.]
MDIKYFFTVFLDNCIIIPAAILCLIPMRNQLKFGMAKTMKFTIPILIVSIALLTWLTDLLGGGPNSFLVLYLIVFFICYHKTLKVHISESLAVFSYICVLMALIGNFTIIFDASLHPASGANTFSMEASLFQLGLGALVTVLFAYPMYTYGTVLTDNLNLPHVWFTTEILSVMFLSVNILIRPIHYETLYTNNVFFAFVIVLSMMFLTLILLTIIFYFIVSGMIKMMDTRERNRILEMQESQYIKQQEYMERSAAVRHDFRQTIRTLEKLAEDEDYGAIREYIRDYAETMPVGDVIKYCANHAVNALLNYYHESAEAAKIDTRWEIVVPEELSVSSSDLCSIIGNLLENAIAACAAVPEDDRYIDLSINTTEDDGYLCIVMTNPYAGTLRKVGDHYVSTKRNGSGIGLSSAASIVSQYGGVARFTDENGEFCSDVMIGIS